MTKFSTQEARDVAKMFKHTSRSHAWAWTTCHDEIVDALVMDHVRIANAYNFGMIITPRELMDFRMALVKALAKNGYVL